MKEVVIQKIIELGNRASYSNLAFLLKGTVASKLHIIIHDLIRENRIIIIDGIYSVVK